MAVRITHTNNSSGHDGTYIYRSTVTMDPGNLPPPLFNADPAAGTEFEFIDNSNLDPGDYFYRTQDHSSGNLSAASNEAVLTIAAASAPARSEITVALVSANITHTSSINTKQSLVNAGFLAENIIHHQDTSAPPAADIIAICRGVGTQEKWDLIKPAWSSGTPILFGSPQPSSTAPSALAGLTGNTSSFVENGYRREVINSEASYITEPYEPGSLTIYPSGNFGFILDDGAPYAGKILATGDQLYSAWAGNPTLIEIPAGTNDLELNPTPAKSVVWFNLYAGQSQYTADGSELLARCIEWCLT